MLGETLRRRHPEPAPRPPRPPRPRSDRRRRLTWGRWLLAALIILVGSFVTGYLLSTLVLFPAPERAGTGIAVPDLYGAAREEAEGTLVEAGLSVGRVELLASLDAPAGQVIAQSPVPGQQLLPGASVDLTLSGGPPEVGVPAVQGLGASTARTLLEEAGFDVAVQQIPSEAPAGAVSRTDPAPGVPVTLPTTVTLFVSLGPPQVDPGLGTLPPPGGAP